MSNKEIKDLIIDAIDNGILLDNGTVRDIDILDYYLISNKSFNSFYDNILPTLTNEERKKINKYARRLVMNRPGSEYYVPAQDEIFEETKKENVIKINYIKNVCLDEEGNYIPGTGRELTESEKIEAYEFVAKCPNAPLLRLFNVALRRIANDIPLDNTVQLPEIKSKKGHNLLKLVKKNESHI